MEALVAVVGPIILGVDVQAAQSHSWHAQNVERLGQRFVHISWASKLRFSLPLLGSIRLCQSDLRVECIQTDDLICSVTAADQTFARDVKHVAYNVPTSLTRRHRKTSLSSSFKQFEPERRPF